MTSGSARLSPGGTDDDRIEIYPYCDPESKAVAPSIKPFN